MFKKSILIVSLLVSGFSTTALANPEGVPTVVPTREALLRAMDHNLATNRASAARPVENILESLIPDELRELDKVLDMFTEETVTSIRPFAEYEKGKYIFFSYTNYYEAKEIKKTIVKNLPDDISVVVMYNSANSKSDVMDLYGDLIADKSRLIALNTKNSGKNPGFWARDNTPIPVYVDKGEGISLGGVDAKYYYPYEPDDKVNKFADASWLKHNYYYEGGNFMADSKANCFTVQWGTAKDLPDDVLTSHYGCQSITRLPFSAGIGHIDERVKFMSDSQVITDTEEYVEILEDKGYEVTLIPRPKGHSSGTYVNALMVNGSVFIPVYGIDSDDEVVEAYKSFGLKTFPLSSVNLSGYGQGSIHCITMLYPDMDSVVR